MLPLTEPLLIVDGVIQFSDIGPKLDLASLNIAAIEISRGVHTTSLFGQRAALGVVAIQTRRSGS
jgi:hypothetical protein